jgi:hypothetical protein
MITLRIHAAESRSISIQITDKIIKENLVISANITKEEMKALKDIITSKNIISVFTNPGAVSLDSVRIVL